MTTGTEEGKHTASESRHLIHIPHFSAWYIRELPSLIIETYSPSLTSFPYLKTSWLQLLKPPIRIIGSTYLNQTLPIRLSAPAKDVLARGRVVLIDASVGVKVRRLWEHGGLAVEILLISQ